MATERWVIYRSGDLHPMTDIRCAEYEIEPNSWKQACIWLAMGRGVVGSDGKGWPLFSNGVLSIALSESQEPYRPADEPVEGGDGLVDRVLQILLDRGLVYENAAGYVRAAIERAVKGD